MKARELFVSPGPLAAHAETLASEMTDDLRKLVEHESPTGDVDRLDRMAETVLDLFAPLGPEVVRHRIEGVGTHLELRFVPDADGESLTTPAVLVLGHMDTVHPVGTLESNRFRIEQGRAYGPGTQDMKAGVVIIAYALRVLRALGIDLPRPVIVLVTADEEAGSPTSRDLIERLAADSRYALVLEAASPGGAVKTRRKGVAQYDLEVVGKAAHAGMEPEKGHSANVELARLTLALDGIADHRAGTSVNVGTMTGGTAVNVVAEFARAEVDVRFLERGEAHRVDGAIRGLEVGAGASLTVSGGINRMPLERTEAVAELYERARTLAAQVDWDLPESTVGGASDGNITAAVGLPTLDGLGADGAGMHTPDEYADIRTLPIRVALVASLIATV